MLLLYGANPHVVLNQKPGQVMISLNDMVHSIAALDPVDVEDDNRFKHVHEFLSLVGTDSVNEPLEDCTVSSISFDGLVRSHMAGSGTCSGDGESQDMQSTPKLWCTHKCTPCTPYWPQLYAIALYAR